jgi:hypothetical protein
MINVLIVATSSVGLGANFGHFVPDYCRLLPLMQTGQPVFQKFS